NGNSVTKTGGCDGCYDAGAISQQTITAGDGYAQFSPSVTGPLRATGLTQSFASSNPGTIAFGIRFQGATAEVREGGAYRPVTSAATGNSLTKTGGCDGCYDAGAASQQPISAGDGYAQFTAGATGPLRVAGLTSGFSVTNPATIAFGIRLQGNIAEVREGGV